MSKKQVNQKANATKPLTTIYHYTKCFHLNSIFDDGFISREKERGTGNREELLTNYVWLTEKKVYPKTALPFCSEFPETYLPNHINNRKIQVDLEKIGAYFGTFYRFSFNRSAGIFKKWLHSDERKLIVNNMIWRSMEKVAEIVGDDYRSFWISAIDVPLENFTLEAFQNGEWKTVLRNESVSMISDAGVKIITELRDMSAKKRQELGIPMENFLSNNYH